MMLFPAIPIPNDRFFRPPLLYDLMNSIVNFGIEDKKPITQFAENARERIFNFEYPLSIKVNKAEFETMILNKFLMRRISYETFTAWQIQLNVKLNEIMPYYNKLFDSFDDWSLFHDGENYTKTTISDRDKTGENNKNLKNKSTLDSRYSKLPQNEINNVKDGTYMTDYSLNQNDTNGDEKTNYKENENGNVTEEFKKDIGDKIEAYNKFLENRNKIMTMIFNDLEPLFYGLANF